MNSSAKRAVLNVYKRHSQETQEKIEQKQQELARLERELQELTLLKEYYQSTIARVSDLTEE